MASGGGSDHVPSPHNPPPPPSLARNVSYGQEVSGSWMNLSQSFEQQESKLPRRASDIMATLKLKLAILSGGRDNEGRVIVTFPARPRGTQYDHTQLLQTIQYLSTIPSMEASELGFVLVIDGRLLSWADTKMILRTAQEALPGQIHIAYIIQPSQFVHKQQISMGLSKEKDKVEYTIVKVSSVEKIVRHIDQRQITFDLSGLLGYNHDEWLKLRTITEQLLDAYQEYIAVSSQIESHMKPMSYLSPERMSELQNEMGRLESVKSEIEAADMRIKELCESLKNEIDTNSGSTGMTPEMVNSLATVSRISENTQQRQNSLRDLRAQNYRRLDEIFSLKQFELGLAKVNQWIKNKGMDKVLRVDIGDSIAKVLSIQDDFKKLEGKAEAVANDVIELRRIADMMVASEHYAKDSVKERLKKANVKYMKFKTALERRKAIVTTSVDMYKGVNEWRQSYDEHTAEWNDTNSINDIDRAKSLLVSLETQHTHLKEVAQRVLRLGQELVKCLKNSSVAQGDPDFRKSLRFISKVTEEVTEKLRKSHELAAVRGSRLDQYVQLLVCEKDGKEAVANLSHILDTLIRNYGGVGVSLETSASITVEVEQLEDEAKTNHEYARKLLQVAYQQREQLNDRDLSSSGILLTELSDLATSVSTVINEVKQRLDLGKSLFSLHETAQITVRQYKRMSTSGLRPTNDSFMKEIKETKSKAISLLAECKGSISELQDRLKHPLPSCVEGNDSSSVNVSLKVLDDLVLSIDSQEKQLLAVDDRTSPDLEGKLQSMEQVIEDILIWLREYGLSQFTEFLALGFTLSSVQDQWNEFCAFRETCQGLTKQVDDLEKAVSELNQQQEMMGDPKGREGIGKTSKRINDLNRIWRRFLIRVQNREIVLMSLQQFLHGSVQLASMMSDILKSGYLLENLSTLDTMYQTATQQGKELVSLLKDSPDGTQDNQMTEKVAERLKQLTNLRVQIQLLVDRDENTSSTSSSYTSKVAEEVVGKEEGNVEDDVMETEFDEVFVNTVMVENKQPLPTSGKSALQQFEEAEKAVTILQEEFAISIGEFLQEHNLCPSSRTDLDKELLEHQEFLNLKTPELEGLKSRMVTLRSIARGDTGGVVHEGQLQFLSNQIVRKLPGRVSLLERRISAFKTLSALFALLIQCVEIKENFNSFMTASGRDKLQKDSTQGVLKRCAEIEKEVEGLTLKCAELAEDFTEQSSDIEMRGLEARKRVRQIRQELEDSAYKLSHSLKRKRRELEAGLKEEDVQAKLLELINWLSIQGVPAVEGVAFGRSCEEAQTAYEDLKNLGTKGESIGIEMKSVTGAVNLLASSELSELSAKLVLLHSNFTESFSSKLEALSSVVEFFTSADTLKEELVATISVVDSVQALNPIVIDKLYTVLCKQADGICNTLEDMENTEATIIALREHLSHIKGLVSEYLELKSPATQRRSSSPTDTSTAVYSVLDDFLEDIQKNVQEAIDCAVGVSPTEKTPIKQKDEGRYRRGSSDIECSEKPSTSEIASHRGSTVSSLKKLFEPANSKPTRFNVPQSTFSNPPGSPRKETGRSASVQFWSNTVGTYPPPKRRLSSSSSAVSKETSSPSIILKETPSIASTTTSRNQGTGEIEMEMTQDDESTPVSTGSNSTTVSKGVPPASGKIVVVKTKESAPLHSTITINIKSVTNNHTPVSMDTPPPVPPPPKPEASPPTRPPLPKPEEPPLMQPPLPKPEESPPMRPPLPKPEESPPMRPPLPKPEVSPPMRPPLPNPEASPPMRPPLPITTSTDNSDDTESYPSTPPPNRPPLPPTFSEDESSQELFTPVRPRDPPPPPPITLQSDTSSQESNEGNLASNNKLPPSTYSSENSQYEDSSSDHTPRPMSPHIDHAPSSISNDTLDNESNSYSNDGYIANDTIPDGAYSNGYYNRVSELRMEESIRPRDLSPVLEEELDEEEANGDHTDMGWRLARDKNNRELTRAHKQSMLSMKALIKNFYEDEILYADTLSKLIKVYVPVLQHTGVFNSVYPIAEFERTFVENLGHSMSTIPDLCNCFNQNLENFKLYFPFVLGYDTALQIITSVNPDELSASLPEGTKISESDLIMEYTAPYHRIEVYCSLFQQLLRAAFKEDLMNLAALSETLEYLLDLLRILAMELATTKLQGCPFPVQATDVLAMNPFLVHLANKVKDVLLYTVFLHPQALVITERHLDEPKEHTLYTYIMHIPISGMVLIENFRGLSDRFAVCEKSKVTTENFVVFRSCDDISVKDFWVNQIKMLLQKESEDLAPQATLLPEQVEQLGYMLPTSAPPPPGPSKTLEPLRKRKSFKRQKRVASTDTGDLTDGFQTPESPIMENVFEVIMDHRISDGPLAQEYLSIKEGDLVEVLEIRGTNYYCVKFPSDSEGEEGEEGFVPACCVRPLPFRNSLNHNSNNNTGEDASLLLANGGIPAINTNGCEDLERDWMEFCSRTGRFEPFPDCITEQDLLNAKMDSLVKYYSDQHQQQTGARDNHRREIDTTDGGSLAPERSDTVEESARRRLYKAPFLGNAVDDEPSYAQLDGVFSLKHPYAAMEQISSDTDCQIELRKGQLVKVLDSKRDDWWLVSTFTEGDVGKQEGWVNRYLLQHAEYIREDVAENSSSNGVFSIQLWLTLAQYHASDEGTISINEGELVEVIDNSRNKWSLVKTLGRQPREGWIPTEYITPYNFSENDLPNSPLSPGVSVHPSIRVDDSVSSAEGNCDFSLLLSPTMSLGELDSEEKRKEALEKRDCTLSELYDSEREYVERLEYCITNYKQPIESLTGTGSTAPKALKGITHDLFTNIEEIHRFHKEEMLPRIDVSQQNPGELVELFSFANMHLKNLYVTYCKGQQKSETIIREHIDYFKELSSLLKDRLSLRDYLILPIQRITKYNLLLKNVHDYSVKSGHHIAHFQTVLGAAQEISRQANNSVHMSMIEATPKRLSEFGKLVLQDEFEFADQTTAKGQFKHRRVFLFEKSLVVAKPKKESPERESYMIRETFLLNEISLGEDDHYGTTKNIVIYEMGTGNKFILKASTSKVHDEWLKKANELASLSKKLSMAASIIQGPVGSGRIRSLSEPLDVLPPFIASSQGFIATSNNSSPLIRQGSQRLRRSNKNIVRPMSSTPHSKSENFEPGTRFVVMEKIVPQGVEDFELEPGEEVELIKTESNGLLTICTVDECRLTGTVPSGYLRHRDLVTENFNTAPKITRDSGDLTQYLYDNILISCAFNGFPEPTVEWKRNDETVVNSDRIKISSCPTSSVLEIRDLQYQDEGQYVCQVSNELGEDRTSMDLYVEGPPAPPSKPIASKVTVTSVKLKWHPPEHNGHSIITYYTVEQLKEGFGEWQPIVQQPRTTFIVKTLNPNTWYQFRVIACNDNGESRASEPSDIVNTTKGKGMFMSPATKRRYAVDGESKTTEDIDHGGTVEVVPQMSTSYEDLTGVGSPGTMVDITVSTHGYHMIRQSSVSSVYDLVPDELGRGRYGILHRCVNKTSGAMYCAKYLKQTELAKNEVKTLHGLCRGKMCDNLVQWVDAIQAESNIIIIMEYIEGGEMIDVILKKDSLTEGTIVSYLKQLLKALEYIHEKKIIHCDIKPENILLCGEGWSMLKLVDFGSAHSDQSQCTLPIETLPHSMEFCAPEIINKHTVTTFADMWSVGVLTYILLSGMSPFFVESVSVLTQKVMELSFDFNHPDFQQVSPEAKDFVAMLLKRNPTQRLPAPNALQHSWIKTLDEAHGRCSTWLGVGIDLNKLKVFHVRRKLQTSLSATKASSVFRSHTPSLSPASQLTEVTHKSPELVECPPILEEGTEEVRTPINANITLEWLFTGHPTPSIVWEHKERKVVPSGRVRITTENGLCQLSIIGVVKADEGVYTCCALNSLGSHIQECHVIVLDKPSTPYGVTGVLLESTSAMVSWSKPLSSGNSIITHYTLEMRQVEYDHWELVDNEIEGMAHVINGLLPGATYIFRVAAVNYIGMSDFSKPSSPIHIIEEDGSRSDSPYMLNEASIKKIDIKEEYNLRNEIGRGAYSIVYECVERSTDRLYAAKCIPKHLEKHALTEFECLKRLNHPRIVKLEEVFDMADQTVLILEYLSNGELSGFVSPSSPLDEVRAARYTRHITEGLQYLHDLGFIHANISPKHLLLSSGQTDLKIAGFSNAHEEHNNEEYREIPISPEYHAPEAVELQYVSFSADLWSLGAVILFMLTGYPPFHAPSIQQLVADIKAVSVYHECNNGLTTLSDDCYDLVFKGLLIQNPRKRLTSHQCQRHRWVQNIGTGSRADQSSDEGDQTPVTASSRRHAGGLKHMNTEEQVQYFLTKYQNVLQSSPNSS